MKQYILPVMTSIFLLSACVEDKGSYKNLPVNEVTVDKLEEDYSVIANVTELDIKPEIKGTIEGSGNYDYTWYACRTALVDDGTAHNHTVLGREKDLKTVVDLAPGNYILYLSIVDKDTSLEWLFSTKLTVQTTLSIGFYVMGDKEDGTVAMDFLSMPTGGDSLIIKDIFVNEDALKGAEDLLFSGNSYKSAAQDLWAVTESGSFRVTNFVSQSSEFTVNKYFNENDIFFTMLEVKRPIKVLDMFPHQISGGKSLVYSSKGYISEDAIFVSSIILGEGFGNPINRYGLNSTKLFKPYKRAFYQGGASYLRAIVYYDMDNECFVTTDGYSWEAATACMKLKDNPGDDFPWNQTNRSLVYGENASNGYSYALMKDKETAGKYYIYVFNVYSLSVTQKIGFYEVDAAKVTDFDKASAYAFFGEQPIVVYAVGNKLWGYNYSNDANKPVLLKDFGAEITYMAFDFVSKDSDLDILICTYDAANKGTIYKYEMKNDPNVVEMELKENCEWKTDLKVKKMEYRNSSY